jgi:hypothetical protein
MRGQGASALADLTDHKVFEWVATIRHHDVQYLTDAGGSLGGRKTWGKGLELTAAVAFYGFPHPSPVSDCGSKVR